MPCKAEFMPFIPKFMPFIRVFMPFRHSNGPKNLSAWHKLCFN